MWPARFWTRACIWFNQAGNPVITGIRVGKYITPNTTFGRVVLDLSRMVGYSVDTRPDSAAA